MVVSHERPRYRALDATYPRSTSHPADTVAMGLQPAPGMQPGGGPGPDADVPAGPGSRVSPKYSALSSLGRRARPARSQAQAQAQHRLRCRSLNLKIP